MYITQLFDKKEKRYKGNSSSLYYGGFNGYSSG